MREIAMATDSQLRDIAREKANYDYATSPRRKVENKFANAIPVMDSLLTAAATKGTLKEKVLSGGNQLKDWGIFLAVTHCYNKAINKIVDKSETLQNFRDNSPFAYNFVNTALGVTAGISGIHYINKGYQKFVAPLIPKSIKNAAKDLINSTDESSIGTAINKGMKNFSKKYPKITNGFSTAAKFAMPVLCIAFMTSMVIDAIKTKSKENKIFKDLSDARLSAAQDLAAKNM